MLLNVSFRWMQVTFRFKHVKTKRHTQENQRSKVPYVLYAAEWNLSHVIRIKHGQDFAFVQGADGLSFDSVSNRNRGKSDASEARVDFPLLLSLALLADERDNGNDEEKRQEPGYRSSD